MAKLFLTVASLWVLFCIRNELVFSHKMKAIDWAHIKAQEHIARGGIHWEQYYDMIERRSHIEMIVDLRKWSFHDFFPVCAN